MAEQTFDHAPSRSLASIDRYSPGVLLPLAVVFGLLAQYLFYGAPLGINLGIAVLVLLAIARRIQPAGARVDALDRWIAPAAMVFAFLPARRVDLMLLLFDVPATIVLVAMAAVSFAGVPITRRALDILMVLGLVVAGRILAGGAVLLSALPDVGRPLARRAGGRLVSVGIGIALAFPFVVVFALLFSSADAVFSRALRNLLDLNRWSIGELIGRAFVALLFAWVAGGILVVAGRGAETGVSPVLPRLRGLLGSTAGTTMLLAVDVLFSFFVALQIAYLFGGRDTLDAIGLTYSDYARRGFFELIAVAVIAGGLLFTVELVVATRSRLYIGAALALIAATLVIVVSAAYRMHLYQLAYGWTEQRFYANAGIVWLAAGGLAALVLVSRDATRWLMHAGGLGALAVAVAVNLIGPSAFVARQNLERVVDPAGLPADANRRLDAYYLGTLGDGAVPTLVEYLPRLNDSDRARLGSALRTFHVEGRSLDPQPFQGFSLDRERARQALLSVVDDLRRYPLWRF
ncbi:MAG TPA: DUF4173 domain-containing protein [Candidatus Limnocylindria bacterium]|jgi:hypothetical protein|nr:DUF4173 domain-containing protein [Candidatus Limnocylindria bacterium]